MKTQRVLRAKVQAKNAPPAPVQRFARPLLVFPGKDSQPTPQSTRVNPSRTWSDATVQLSRVWISARELLSRTWAITAESLSCVWAKASAQLSAAWKNASVLLSSMWTRTSARVSSAATNAGGQISLSLKRIRAQQVARSSSKRLQVAATASLGEKRFVAVIQVDGREFLIGGGAGNVSLLAQLDAQKSFDGMLTETMAEPKKQPVKRVRKRIAKPAVEQAGERA